MNEKELAHILKEHLKDYEIFQEVSAGMCCPRADIVAVKDGISWVIETKLSMTLSLLRQACNWQTGEIRPKKVSVCISSKNRDADYEFAYNLLKKFGIGIIIVSFHKHKFFGESIEVKTILEPQLFESDKTDILKYCFESNKNFCEAGSNKSQVWTPYKEDILKAKNFIIANGPSKAKDILKHIDRKSYFVKNLRENFNEIDKLFCLKQL